MPGKYRQDSRTTKKQVLTFLFVLILLFTLYLLVDNRLEHSFKYIPSEYKAAENIIRRSNTVEEAILHAIRLLDIPEKKYSYSTEADTTSFRIGVNSQIMDLNFVNSIVTGQIELSGGETLTGYRLSSGNRQVLHYYDPDLGRHFEINLYYSRYGTMREDPARLAIIIDDFGYFKGDLLESFCQLNKNITFAILPHQKHSRLVMEKAAESGHESIIHMPMEPISYPKINPGPDAIYTHLSQKEIQKRVQGYIKNLPLCIGANNHMGSLATADRDVMTAVLKTLKKNGLYFIDSRTSQASVAYSTARELMLPAFENTLFLDTPEVSEEVLQVKINRVRALSANRDKIVIITHCASRKHLEHLKHFLAEIEDMNIELIPASGLFESELPDIL